MNDQDLFRLCDSCVNDLLKTGFMKLWTSHHVVDVGRCVFQCYEEYI